MLYQVIVRINADYKVKYNRLFTNMNKAHKYGRMVYENEKDVFVRFIEIRKDCDGAYNVSDIKV